MTYYTSAKEIRDRISELEEIEEPSDGEQAEYDALTEADDTLPRDCTLVHESDLARHARDLVDDVEPVDFDRWPYSLIDWDCAGKELSKDYTVIEIQGETYYYLET